MRFQNKSKPIKFSLVTGGKECRTVDEVKKNFDFNSLYENFSNGSLQKWLKQISETDLAREIEKIAGADIITQKIRLFNLFSPKSFKSTLISMVEKAKDFKWFDADEAKNNQRADALINKINDKTEIISQKNEEILFKESLNAIQTAANNKLENITKKLVKAEQGVVLYNTPDDELDEKKELFFKTTKRLGKKIEDLSNDINDNFNYIISKGKRDLADAVDSACRKMNSIVDNWGTLQSFDKIQPQLESEIKILTETLKRLNEDIARNAKNKLRDVVRDFFVEAEEIFYSYLLSDFEEELYKKAQRKIEIDIDNDEIFKIKDSGDSDEGSGIGKSIEEAFVELYNVRAMVFSNHLFSKLRLQSAIGVLQNTFNPSKYLNVLINGKEKMIAVVTETFKEGVLADLENQIKEMESKKADKAKALAEAKELFDKLQAEQKAVLEQMAEMGMENKE